MTFTSSKGCQDLEGRVALESKARRQASRDSPGKRCRLSRGAVSSCPLMACVASIVNVTHPKVTGNTPAGKVDPIAHCNGEEHIPGEPQEVLARGCRD